jgi:NSS family neurotransmitter:Na+ symporter
VLKFPAWAYGYMRYVVPALVIIVLIMGWVPVVSTWVGA